MVREVSVKLWKLLPTNPSEGFFIIVGRAFSHHLAHISGKPDRIVMGMLRKTMTNSTLNYWKSYGCGFLNRICLGGGLCSVSARVKKVKVKVNVDLYSASS